MAFQRLKDKYYQVMATFLTEQNACIENLKNQRPDKAEKIQRVQDVMKSRGISL